MNSKAWYARGLRDGIPIGLGYLAVGFSLGITAQQAGITALQMGLMSFTMHASAGQYAAIAVIAGKSGYLVMMLTQFIINLRYLLMSCSLSQKIDPATSMPKRMLLSYFVTDELFGISSSVQGRLNPYYHYGAATVASPGWVIGTVLGVVAGGRLQLGGPLTDALSVALYAMFLAVVVPGARASRTVMAVALFSMGASLVFTLVPALASISEGMRILILTVLIAAAAAILRPVPPETVSGSTADEDTAGSGKGGA